MNSSKQIDDVRSEYLDALAARIDEQAKVQSAYLTGNEDAAEPLFYSDWEVDLSTLDDETREQVEQLKEREPSTWQSTLKDLCSVECVGVYVQNDEIASFTLGECHEQLEDELVAELDQLTPAERDYVSRQVSECYLPDSGDYVCLNHSYDRWVLILDPEQLAERLADVAE